MGQTIVQKILARTSGNEFVQVGDVVEPKVDLAMSHENGSLAISQFDEIYKNTGFETKVWDPTKIALIFDHRVPAESRKTATNQNKIRKFVKEQGIPKFHDIRGDRMGVCHQILPQYGYVRPGFLVVGTDSHTTTHGALGAFAFGIGATEMATVWTLGSVLNITVPPTIKVVCTGKFRENIGGKDLILHLIGKISAEGANFKVLEYHGESIQNMPMTERLTVSNMSVEAGATAGIIPADDETVRYLREESGVTDEFDMVYSDPDAEYCQVVNIDVSELESQIACPHTVDNVKPISEVVGTAINQIVLGSCTNGRIEDIAVAAKILKGKSIAESVRMIVVPASAKVYREALEKGYFIDLMDAGCVVTNPGCGPCLGVHQGALGDGEVALATTNRNFKGRMGNPDAFVYLCSPAVAAASAISGTITDPNKGAK
ncbi:MAG: 3-isopropylmalate dehydratase large subunit [Candidatus Kapabacteria bacterium]|nr:3-isopropylmalate dehydratase large subunit [Candidatus Kapabacteria bacterium]